ncbi:hypothetical protein [Ferrimicrobium acidiphilum]|jgi:hypothetical protein|uniref:hypothetical protein n=1 Tax=Ferrimicrobium acidiphilum TaxID=121039 RepID=UPI0023F0F853|nr:hypothetical protein [Ferrimicrobium acidiphilum]
MLYKKLQLITVALALPTVLAACGSTSASTTSPKQAIATSVKFTSTQPDSFHVSETLSVTLDKSPIAHTTTSGDVYDDPSNPSNDYASLSTVYDTSGHSNGSFQIIVDHGHAYFDMNKLHLPQATSLAKGWVQVPLPSYMSSTQEATKQAVSASIPLNSRFDLLKMLLSHASFSSNGSTSVDGHLVTQYIASISVSKFEQIISPQSGQMATELAHIMEIYRLAGTMKFTVDINSNNLPVQIATSITSSFKSGSTYQLGIQIASQFSNYGITFKVSPPASAKPLTNFSSI